MSRYKELINSITAPDDFEQATLRGFTCMRMASDRIIHIDGHNGILHYDQSQISFRAKNMDVDILGNSLTIVSFSKTHIRIKGQISAVNMRRHKH